MYNKAIVTFLDILGFREKVSKLESKEINEILDIVEKVTTPDKSENTPYSPEAIVFSDSIVRTRQLTSKENLKYPIGLLFHELLSIVHAQSELIDYGILIRGGIAFGDICVDQNRIFGPALIQAYDLESQFAKYPRFIVDPELIKEYKTNKLLRRDEHSIKEDSTFVKSLLRQGDDGLWFIDYARAVESELDEPEMYPSFLKRHRDVIIDGCSDFKGLNKNLEKYVWLANYHNTVIMEIKDAYFESYKLDREDFYINSEELPALQYIIS